MSNATITGRIVPAQTIVGIVRSGPAIRGKLTQPRLTQGVYIVGDFSKSYSALFSAAYAPTLVGDFKKSYTMSVMGEYAPALVGDYEVSA